MQPALKVCELRMCARDRSNLAILNFPHDLLEKRQERISTELLDGGQRSRLLSERLTRIEKFRLNFLLLTG